MPTLTALRGALALALDDLETEVVAVAGSTTSIGISELLAAVTGVTSNMYEGRWIYHRQGGRQRKVQAYVPGTGALTITPAWTAPTPGDTVEFTGLFPCIPAPAAETDYRTLLNRALGRMAMNVEVEVAIVAFQDTYPMTAFPSLDRPERLRGVREPSPFPGRQPVDSMWRGWEAVPDPPTMSLRAKSVFGVSTGNIEVEWTRPASTWIKVAGTWAESAVGLVNESDEAQPAIEEILPFALVEALNVLIARTPGRPNAEWARMLKDAEDAVERSWYRDRTQVLAPQPAQPTVAA